MMMKWWNTVCVFRWSSTGSTVCTSPSRRLVGAPTSTRGPCSYGPTCHRAATSSYPRPSTPAWRENSCSASSQTCPPTASRNTEPVVVWKGTFPTHRVTEVTNFSLSVSPVGSWLLMSLHTPAGPGCAVIPLWSLRSTFCRLTDSQLKTQMEVEFSYIKSVIWFVYLVISR